MDDVGVVLNVLVVFHLHPVTVAAEVVTGKIDQHHMLGILLGVVAQELSAPAVSLRIPRPFRRTCYGVNVGTELSFTRRRTVGHRGFYSAVCLWRGAEDAEASEVEVEQVW